MRILGSNLQLPYFQPVVSTDNSTSSSFGAALASQSTASSHDGTPNDTFTAEDKSTGFFGSSRATLQAALDAGEVVNTLSFLTSSDIDLIQKTTGVTIKDGAYYDQSGTEVGIHYDGNGNLAEPDAANTQAAFHLANSLSEMRFTGGPEGSTGLQGGKDVTADDLAAYLKDYAAAAGPDIYRPDVNIIKKAESMIESERT